jgi:hypothetical protein
MPYFSIDGVGLSDELSLRFVRAETAIPFIVGVGKIGSDIMLQLSKLKLQVFEAVKACYGV